MAYLPKAKVTVYLDQRESRRTKKQIRNKTYPIKIRIWDTTLKRARFKSTGIELTKRQFESAWLKAKPRTQDHQNRNLIQKALMKYTDAVDDLPSFSFDRLQRKVSMPTGEVQNVLFHLERRYNRLIEEERFSTAEGYKAAIRLFRKYNGGPKLAFTTIDVRWLKAFENWMIKTRECSLTTVGIYTRYLRVVYNEAIAENIVKPEFYPFGRGKYVIPTSKRVRKVLTPEQLQVLLNATPKTIEQEMARDYFFFSYGCNGMNTKDIVNLRYSQMEGDKFTFVRSKTRTTNRGNPIIITVFLTELTKGIMERYCNHPMESDYVFPIIYQGIDPEDKHRLESAFRRFINQHLKPFCIELGLPPATSYWARHSFATNAVKRGASLELMQECLGHTDIKTTQIYFAGFDDEEKRKVAQSVVEFL